MGTGARLYLWGSPCDQRAEPAPQTAREINGFLALFCVLGACYVGRGASARIEKRPAVVGDQIVPRDQMVLSLTFDHRIVDGAPAAKFLAGLRDKIENPSPWLVF